MRRLWPLMSGATDRAFIVPPRVIRAAMLALPLVSMSPATTVAQEAQSLNEGVVVDVTPQSGTPSAGGEATDVQVDESALRYYAQTGRYDRLEGEIRRLRALHPGWSPPDDLFDPQPEFDEKPLWDLLAEGRLDDLAAAINEYRATRPDWAPSDALRREQGLAVARAALQEAVTAGDWSRAVAIGRGTPELIGCVDPQSTWLYAQAQAQAAPQAARETLGELMGDCEDFDVRLATLQKAADLLPWNDVLALRAVEAEREHSPTETARLEEIFTELSYGRIARQLSQDTGAVPPDELERFISDVQEASDAEAAALLGWYFLRRQDWARADVWFRRSLAWGYSDSAAEGIIRVRLGQDDRAVPWPWRRSMLAAPPPWSAFAARSCCVTPTLCPKNGAPRSAPPLTALAIRKAPSNWDGALIAATRLKPLSTGFTRRWIGAIPMPWKDWCSATPWLATVNGRRT